MYYRNGCRWGNIPLLIMCWIFRLGKKLVDQVIREQPKIIGVVTNEVEFPQLSGILTSNYVLVKEIDGLLIYLRLNQTLG